MAVRVRGLKELERKLQAFPERVARNALSSSVGAGARLVRDNAKARAPGDEGRLYRNIIAYRMRKGSTRHAISWAVTVKTKGDKDSFDNAYYWTFVEFGTRYQVAQPFLRPAFESNKLRAVGVIARALRRRLQTEAAKL